MSNLLMTAHVLCASERLARQKDWQTGKHTWREAKRSGSKFCSVRKLTKQMRKMLLIHRIHKPMSARGTIQAHSLIARWIARVDGIVDVMMECLCIRSTLSIWSTLSVNSQSIKDLTYRR